MKPVILSRKRFKVILALLLTLLTAGCANPARQSLEDQFAEAVYQNDAKQVRKMLQQNPYLANKPQGDRPYMGVPLTMACDNLPRRTDPSARRQTIHELIKGGADINEVDDYGVNVVWWAVRTGDEQLVRMLLKAGAKPYTGKEGIYYKRPAAEAAKRCEADILKVFAETGNSGMDSLHLWAAIGDAQKLKEALKADSSSINDVDVNDRTPLDYARFCGYDDCARVLLDAGALPKDKRPKGNNEHNW